MPTSESILDSFLLADVFGLEDREISDYELEVEEFDSLSSNGGTGRPSEAQVGSVSMPYDKEPIVDEEWVKKYYEKEEKQSTLR